MKKLIALLTLFLFSGLTAQNTLTLNEAISIALQRNSNLIKSKNNIQANESRLKNAYGELLPDFNLRGSWNWRRVEDDGGAKITDFFGRESIQPSSKTDTRSYSLSAGGSVVLFNGLSNLANISQKKNDLEAAQLSLEKLKQDITYQTINLYYAVLNAKELVQVRKDNLKFNQKLLEDIQERNKVGSVAIADVYTQQVQFGNAQLALIKAQNDFENAKSNLLNFLALDVLKDYDFENPNPKLSTKKTNSIIDEFGNIEQMVNFALRNRKDYKSQMLSLSSAQKGLTIARGNYFPSLSGDYSFSASATKPDDVFKHRVWSVGLSLNFPIFSNWRTENQTQLAKVQIENVKEDLTALERQIKIDIKQGYLDLLAAKKKLDVSTSNVKSAEENRKINQERYRLGSGTILDILQADKDYTQAQSDKINAEYQYYQLRDKLINSLGKLEIKKYE